MIRQRKTASGHHNQRELGLAAVRARGAAVTFLGASFLHVHVSLFRVSGWFRLILEPCSLKIVWRVV